MPEDVRDPVLSLGRDALTVADVARFARQPTDVGIDPASGRRMAASVALRDRLIATGQPIYGVTTGFGDSVRTQLSTQKVLALQHNLIQYHLNGSGAQAEADVVRATMLIRANCLARGYSGVRAEVTELVLQCLRHDILPVVPERGSVGASGDLVPLCYVANAVAGSGQVRYRGQVCDAADALRACGLDPVVYQAKEALAMINGTSFMTAFAALATHDSTGLAVLADLCTALTAEALLGNRGHFHPVIHQQKPHRGQVQSAARIRALLAGSDLAMDHRQVLRSIPAMEQEDVRQLPRSIQDPYSLRCAPHVTGVLIDTLDWVRQWLDIEINSTNDNPLFDVDSSDVLNGGNFYGGHVGQAMDALKIALANVGDLMDRQLALLVDEKFSRGLPANLTPRRSQHDPEAGVHHGFKGAQLACSALAAEALKITGPATVFSRSTEAHNQDKVSMATIAARDARSVVELIRDITAIHLLACCQAVELRGARRLGHGTRAAYEVIRAQVPALDRDRRLDHDLAEVRKLIQSGALRQALTPHLADERDHVSCR